MEQVSADRPNGLSGDGLQPAAEPRLSAPVKWWAALGGVFVVLQIYVFTDWIASGNAKTTPTGANPVPEWMKWTVHSQEAIAMIALFIFVYFFMIRPWRREGRLTLDGLLIIAFALTYWQDPLYNYSQFWTTYNAEVVNLGSWATSIPGWIAPNANLYPDPLLWAGPAYIWALFGGCVLANWFMGKVKARWPEMGTIGLILSTYCFFLVVVFIAETLWLRTGIYTYAGAIPELSLFRGNYFQFPIYEVFLFATYWTAWACLRYFRNDKGETLAERGLDRVRTTPRRRTAVRLLALTGAVNVILLVFGIIPTQFFALQGGPFPEDFDNRSYLRDGICGPGTEYACASPDIPIPRPDSSHVDPEGNLVPGDTERGPQGAVKSDDATTPESDDASSGTSWDAPRGSFFPDLPSPPFP